MNTKNRLPKQIWTSNNRSDEPNPDDLDLIDGDMHHPVKPIGGMWTSTYTPEAEFDSEWISWCVREDFCGGQHKWLMKPKNELDVLVVNSFQDLREIVEIYEKPQYKGIDSSGIDDIAIDFLQIASDFDAMHLTRQGRKETNNFHENLSLSVWDTETVLSFRWNWQEYEYLGLCEDIKKETDQFHRYTN